MELFEAKAVFYFTTQRTNNDWNATQTHMVSELYTRIIYSVIVYVSVKLGKFCAFPVNLCSGRRADNFQTDLKLTLTSSVNVHSFIKPETKSNANTCFCHMGPKSFNNPGLKSANISVPKLYWAFVAVCSTDFSVEFCVVS